MTGTSHEDRYTFLIISRSVLLRTRNVSDIICRENQNTFCDVENRAVYEIMWKNILQLSGAGWIPKATNAH